MKRHLLLISLGLSVFGLHSQDSNTAADEPPPGTVSAKIYTHFNYSLDGESTTSFEVRRAYFGYERNLSDRFSAEVKLDIGSIDDQSEFALIRRYTYFKNAYVSYQLPNLKTWFGLMDMLQFKVQEKFWGYRYLYRSFLDEYRFGSSADLGAGIQYNPSRHVTADFVISNGEGYKNLQFDHIYRLGAGLTLYPLKGLILRAYYTIHTHESRQMTFSGFAGYRMAKLRVGGEYNHQLNLQFLEGYDRYGYSLYTTYIINEKWEVFGRYDQLYSNILPENELPWNLVNDGSAIIAGVQYSPIRYIHMALNYQDWVEYAKNGTSEPYIYLNFEIVF
jgi:hypothetical protein